MEAYKKYKAEQSRKQQETQQQPQTQQQQGGSGIRSYLTYSTDFTEKLAEQETDYELSLLSNAVEEEAGD